jgi:hypothetical protein
MPAILPKVRFAVKERLLRNLCRCREAGPASATRS